MSTRHTEILSRIGLAGAIVPTYREQVSAPTREVDKALNRVDQATSAAIALFGRVGKQNLEQIGNRIDEMNRVSCLGQKRSILTFIDFAIETLEQSLKGEKAPASIKGQMGRVAIKRLIMALVDLRLELAGNRNFEICSRAGIKAAGIWEGL